MEEAPGYVGGTLQDGDGTESRPVAVAAWRLALGAAVLLALIALAAMLTPVYLHNLEFQRYVSAMAEDPRTRARNDSIIRSDLVDKADGLHLPVHFENIQIVRAQDGVRITVKYVVHVNLLIYAVDLHFYPGAGSR